MRARSAAMSPLARDQTVNFGNLALRFIGSAERSETKPECISPHTARQWARAARSAGSRPIRLRASTDLPQPVSPTMPSVCPASSARSMPSSATTSPAPALL